jgi:hypothetical protein
MAIGGHRHYRSLPNTSKTLQKKLKRGLLAPGPRGGGLHFVPKLEKLCLCILGVDLPLKRRLFDKQEVGVCYTANNLGK